MISHAYLYFSALAENTKSKLKIHIVSWRGTNNEFDPSLKINKKYDALRVLAHCSLKFVLEVC